MAEGIVVRAAWLATPAQIVDDLIRREGSTLTDRVTDRGGRTKYGITQAAWDDFVGAHPDQAPVRLVDALTEPMARAFYQLVHVGPLARLADAALVALVADCSVNHGPTRAVRWLQSAVGAAPDGRLGPQTATLANKTPTAYAAVLRTRLKFYARIAVDQRSKPGGDPDAEYLEGWINRASEFIR